MGGGGLPRQHIHMAWHVVRWLTNRMCNIWGVTTSVQPYGVACCEVADK